MMRRVKEADGEPLFCVPPGPEVRCSEAVAAPPQLLVQLPGTCDVASTVLHLT